jgi:acyl-coenzyme A synthetase/AMP-(fatty) acid ligase
MPGGYIGDEAASARAFRGGWYYPGDLGYLDEGGALYFRGRADDLMNYDGMKIYPADIEEVLLAHPAVAEAAAFPLPSDRHQDVPFAAVVLRSPVAAATLLDWCRERLGARAPIKLAQLASLPRTERGKVNKQALVQFVRERV